MAYKALQQTITLSNGLTVENAYIRIDTISGYKGGITIGVNSYSSQTAFTSGSSYLEGTKYYTFVPDTSTTASEIFTQGLNYLKANVYTTSVEVIEEE